MELHPLIWMHKNWCNEIWWNYINIDTYMNFDQVHILAMEMWLCTECCLLRHLAPVATSFHEILRSWSSSCASRLTSRWCHFFYPKLRFFPCSRGWSIEDDFDNVLTTAQVAVHFLVLSHFFQGYNWRDVHNDLEAGGAVHWSTGFFSNPHNGPSQMWFHPLGKTMGIS